MRKLHMLLVALLLSGCNGIREPEPLKVGIDTFVGFAPIFLAQDMGVKVKPEIIMDTVARTTALASGDIDALCTTADSLLLAAANGVDLVIVAAVDESAGADGIIVRKEIDSVRDLSGKTVAFQEAMPSHFFLLSLLQRERLDPSDILRVHMNADEAGAAFIAGKVDAAVTWEPWLSRAVEGDKGKILMSTAEFPGVLVDVLAVRRDVLQRHERQVVELYLGWMRAIDRWKVNRAESERLMSTRLGLPLEEFRRNVTAVRFADKAFNERFFAHNQKASIWSLGQSAVTTWKRAGVIKPASTFDPLHHISDEIVELGKATVRK